MTRIPTLSFAVAFFVHLENHGCSQPASFGAAAPAAVSFPFMMPDTPAADSVVDASGWLERPAGKHGFIQARDGHFWAGNRRIRFWGTNLAFGGNFPTMDEAVVMADKLARIGVNVVRLHSFDATDGRSSLFMKKTGNSQQIDRVKLEQFDFLVAKLIERGIYVNLNLHVNRSFLPGDGVEDGGNNELYSKYLSLFDPRMQNLQQHFFAQLLSHVNKYTGVPYFREPGVAFLEITNENSFFYGLYSGKLDNMAPVYSQMFDRQFNDWLKLRFKTQGALQQSWTSELPAGESLETGTVKRPRFDKKAPITPRKRDYLTFLWATEHAYFKSMRDFLKTTMKAQMPITGTMEFTMAGAAIQSDLMDFTDMHAYWQHPHFDTAWKGKWTIDNRPMTENPAGNTLTWAASMRVKGKPYTLSEYNAPWPNFFDSEALPLAAAFGARQDWDGIYIFNYNNDGNFNRKKVISMFDIDGHPVKTAQMIAGAAMFARGDAPVAAHEKVGQISLPTAIELASRFSWTEGEGSLASLGWKSTSDTDTRWATQFVGGNSSPTLVETGEAPPLPESSQPFTWKKNLAVVNTPRSVMVVGKATDEPVVMGDVSMRMIANSRNFGAISMHSMDAAANPIVQSDRVLLLACGRTANTGMKWDPDWKSAYGGMGEAPVLTEGISAEVTMKVPPGATYKVYALNAGGAAAAEVPVETTQDRLRFSIGPDYKTIWYVMQRQK